MKQLIIAAVAIAIIIIFAVLGGTSAFGAHPVAWPIKVAVIGAPIGAVIALIFNRTLPSPMVRIALFTILLLIAYAFAYFGKQNFAASYAEDVLAGKFWFFGWIATCAAATALLTAIVPR